MTMKWLARKLKERTPINWSFLNFVELQVVHMMLLLLTFVWYYQLKGEWMLPIEQQQLVLKGWLWMYWGLIGYSVIGLCIWLWNCAYDVREWWRNRWQTP